jgi:hypothetical protein
VNPSGGQAGVTPSEQALASTATQSFNDYSARWLPAQDHLASVVSSMAPGQPSWQRSEAEGKGNADAAIAAENQSRARTSSELSHGINVGSTSFKMGVTGGATAEAEMKGADINQGNEAIDKAYLGGLTSITHAGEGLASAAVQGQSVAGEVGSRIGITDQQVDDSSRAAAMGGAGVGIGAGLQALSGGKSPPPDPNNPNGGLTAADGASGYFSAG